jgi:hypothetical protein
VRPRKNISVVLSHLARQCCGPTVEGRGVGGW